MQNRLKIAILILLFCGVFVVNLRTVMAQNQESYAINIEPLGQKGEEQIDFVQYIIRFYDLGLKIAGALALLMIVFGGLMIAISGAVNKQQEGRDMIWSALWGLVLLVGANLILRTVNPQLVELKMPSGVKQVPMGNLVYSICDKNNIASYNVLKKKQDENPNDFTKEEKIELEQLSVVIGKTGDIPPCGVKEKPEIEGGKCKCLIQQIEDKMCVGITEGKKIPEFKEVISCIPSIVLVYDSEAAKNFLSEYPYFTKDGEKIKLDKNKLYDGGFKEGLNDGSFKNGAKFFRQPFIRTKNVNPSLIGDENSFGTPTVKCFIYGYITYNDKGERDKRKDFPPFTNNEEWQVCAFDRNDEAIEEIQKAQENEARDKSKKEEKDKIIQEWGLEKRENENHHYFNFINPMVILGESPQNIAVAPPTPAQDCNALKTSAAKLVQDKKSYTHTEAVAELQKDGISIKPGDSSCTGANDICNQNCVSLEGINKDVVNALKELKKECGSNCVVQITGGTELGQISGDHQPGLETVDIGFDTNLENYFEWLINEKHTAPPYTFGEAQGTFSLQKSYFYTIKKICSIPSPSHISIDCVNPPTEPPTEPHYHLIFSKWSY